MSSPPSPTDRYGLREHTVVIFANSISTPTSPHLHLHLHLTSTSLHSAPLPPSTARSASRIPSAPISANQRPVKHQMSKQNAGRSILILQGRRCWAELPKGEVQTRQTPATSGGWSAVSDLTSALAEVKLTRHSRTVVAASAMRGMSGWWCLACETSAVIKVPYHQANITLNCQEV